MALKLAVVSAAALLLLAPSMVAARQQPPPRPPARDTPSQPPGDASGVIRGRVVGGDHGRPLRRARITINAAELGTAGRQTTSTDADGRYEFTGLRPARYRVSVTRGGYLPLEYGQRRPGEQGRPVQLADKQTVDAIDFALPRMSGISGRVTDEFGDPIEGISVFAMRSLFFEGRRRLVPVGSPDSQTDDTGEYRLQRLAPGTYYVMASTRETWVVNSQGTQSVFGYLPTYHPAVANPVEARKVTVGVGQMVTSVDVSLMPGRAPKVSGVALDSRGRPFSRVSLREEIRGLGFGSFRGGPDGPVAADGSFSIAKVPPGEYLLTASRMPGDAQGDPEVAMLPLTVDGTDIENIVLQGSTGGSVTGRIIVDGNEPLKMSTVRMSIEEPLRTQPSPVLLGAFRSKAGGFATASIDDSGTFTVPNVFGRARFKITLPDGWMLKAVEHHGRDISDAPIELRSGEEVSDVQVVITDRVTRVSGHLTDARNEPLRDATVLVYPVDAGAWFESSRRLRAVRPDQRGQWEVKGLPPGEYLAVALDYVDEDAWNDPEYLESLRAYGQKVALGEGASETVTLRLTTPKP